jgi:error-prone DNA polymerase
MIQGFGGYGFPESHAASFALIGYASCYLKRYHPAAFLCALLNSQPMGFYGPHTLVEDGRRHGLQIRRPSVVHSQVESTLETADPEHPAAWWAGSVHREKAHTPWADRMAGRPMRGQPVQPAVRLGLRQVSKVGDEVAERLVAARRHGPFQGVADVVIRADLPKDAAIHLAAAGAFDDLGVSRREALWRVLSVDRKAPLFAALEDAPIHPGSELTEVERMQADYAHLGLSTAVHPVALLRQDLRRAKIAGSLQLERTPSGRRVRVGGMVTVRQRPGTAKGVVFMTLEDEDGQMNLVVFPKTYARWRAVARDAILLVAVGKVERRHRVTNLIVDRFEPMPGPRPERSVSRDFFDGRS